VIKGEIFTFILPLSASVSEEILKLKVSLSANEVRRYWNAKFQ